MKKIFFALFTLLWLLPATIGRASWLIDFEKFSASVHGETSCQDCHPDTALEALHPDPRLVGKGISDFFTPDQCLTCHADVRDDLEEGTHGSLTINTSEDYEACLQCHDPHYQLPIDQKSANHSGADIASLSEEDRACMECHGINPKGDHQKIQTFCFHCHAQTGTRTQELAAQILPLIDPESYRSVAHSDVSCLTCHTGAAAFNHGDQKSADCRQCHARHDEKVAHDAHLLVSCKACHLGNVQAFRNSDTKQVLWQKQRILGTPLNIHAMATHEDQAMCRRCHVSGNEVGAAAMILPPKSVMCMPCHASTFSIADTVSIIALLIFAGGLILTFSIVLTGGIADPDAGVFRKISRLIACFFKTIFSSKIVIIIKTLIVDVLLQRRLYRKSAGRWLIHSFIFLSMVFRFVWGVAALLLSLWSPEGTAAWSLLDKNDPVGAFLFDLTGVLILIGVILAFIRGIQRKDGLPPNLPGQDRLALFLIGAIVLIGFILEGMRIAMTGGPTGSDYAFLGYVISRMFSGNSGLTDIYGYIWYLHAVVTGIFVAYLPFSRLVHMILAPFTLAMNALSEAEHGTKN